MLKIIKGDLRVLLKNEHGWIPVAIAAGTALAGAYASYQSSRQQAEAQKQANKANLLEAQKNRDFQERLSNTAHTREMADLRSAGINPLYTAGGGGASTPSGSMATSTPITPPENLAHGLQKGLNGAVQAARLKQELSSADAKIALDKAATATQASQAQLNTSNASKAAADTITSQAQAKKAAMETTKLEAEMPALAREADLRLKRANIDVDMAQHDAIMNRAKSWTGTASDAISAFFPKFRIETNPGTDRVIDSGTGEILQQSRRTKINRR